MARVPLSFTGAASPRLETSKDWPLGPLSEVRRETRRRCGGTARYVREAADPSVTSAVDISASSRGDVATTTQLRPRCFAA